MNKKILWIASSLLAIAVIALVFISFKKEATFSDTSGIILFYGNGCPHCANVDKYIKENDVESKVEFTHAEVYLNKGNANLMVSLQEKCGLPKESIGGIPFLWNGADSTCLSGDVDIINFFNEKIDG